MPPAGWLLLLRGSVQVALISSGSTLYQALGQGFGHRDCLQLRALSHVGLSVRKVAGGGDRVSELLSMLEVVLGLSLSSHTRL